MKDDATETEGAAAEIPFNVTPKAESENGYTAPVYALGKTRTYHTCTPLGDKAMAEPLLHDSICGCTIHCPKQPYLTIKQEGTQTKARVLAKFTREKRKATCCNGCATATRENFKYK